MTAVNNEGTNIGGGVSVEQTDRGEYNRNLVLPSSGLGGTVVTPINKKLIKQALISGNGKGYLKVEFGQNGNGKPKLIRYTLILQGIGIANCGSGGTSKAFVKY